MTKEQAKHRLQQIAMMPNVAMVGVDREKTNGVSIGVSLDMNHATNDVDDLLLGLMTAYISISLNNGYQDKALIDHAAKTMAVILANMDKTKPITFH